MCDKYAVPFFLIFSIILTIVIASLSHFQIHRIGLRNEFPELVLPCTNQNQSIFLIHESLNFTDPLLRCTYSINDADVAILHAKAILSVLIDIYLKAAPSYDVTMAFQDYVSWILDSFVKMHVIVEQSRIPPGISGTLHEKFQDWTVWTFCNVHKLLNSLRGNLHPSILRKGYTSLTILAAQLLEHAAYLSDASVRLALSSSILNLAYMCQQYDSMRSIVSMRLLPVFEIVNLDDGKRTLLGNDFQVSIYSRNRCIWLIQIQKAVSALFFACCPTPFSSDSNNQAVSFDSQNLFGEFQQLGLHESGIIVAKNGDTDNAQRSKRRKIQDAPSRFEEIVSELCISLGLEEAISPREFGQVAK